MGFEILCEGEDTLSLSPLLRTSRRFLPLQLFRVPPPPSTSISHLLLLPSPRPSSLPPPPDPHSPLDGEGRETRGASQRSSLVEKRNPISFGLMSPYTVLSRLEGPGKQKLLNFTFFYFNNFVYRHRMSSPLRFSDSLQSGVESGRFFCVGV